MLSTTSVGMPQSITQVRRALPYCRSIRSRKSRSPVLSAPHRPAAAQRNDDLRRPASGRTNIVRANARPRSFSLEVCGANTNLEPHLLGANHAASATMSMLMSANMHAA
jgi:hypothetical protein